MMGSMNPWVEVSLIVLEAETLNFELKFYSASKKYLSATEKTIMQLPEYRDFLYEILEKAIICAILSEAGENKTTLLKKIKKDKKTHSVESYDFLSKM